DPGSASPERLVCDGWSRPVLPPAAVGSSGFRGPARGRHLERSRGLWRRARADSSPPVRYLHRCRRNRALRPASSGSLSPRGRRAVVDVHFDTALALARGGPLAARRRQAAALLEALAAAPEDTVLGGDFNTWLGSREPALKVLRRAFPEGDDRATTTWQGPLG